uniref:Secreted salivary protein n=1 Tax=Culicoides nubeculosus TaxID=144565 RepID=B9URM2_CULNU|nr:secreted salivary protein [Culicoides nubeculosus]
MKLLLLIIGLGVVSAATIKYKNNKPSSMEVSIPLKVYETANDEYKNVQPITITIGTPDKEGRGLKRCWTKVWVVKICTFILPENV